MATSHEGTFMQRFMNKYQYIILEQTLFTYSLNDASILIKLTDSEVLKFEKMKEVNDYWMKILKNNIQGERPIILVKDKTWINLAKDFSDYANTLEWHTGKIYE